MSIKGKLRIVITGATRGLGQALVLGMAELGHEIHGCGTSEANVEALQKKCLKEDLQLWMLRRKKLLRTGQLLFLGLDYPIFSSIMQHLSTSLLLYGKSPKKNSAF